MLAAEAAAQQLRLRDDMADADPLYVIKPHTAPQLAKVLDEPHPAVGVLAASSPHRHGVLVMVSYRASVLAGGTSPPAGGAKATTGC